MAHNSTVAIITGSTRGIGLSIARALAQQGCAVLLNGMGEEDAIAAQVADLQTTCGVRAAYSAADMREPAGIRGMVADCEARFGSVDILVNNAGIQFTAPLEAFPDHRWDEILAVNLSAAFHTTKAALPGMRSRNYGRIINIASVHGLVASVHKAAYVAAKHGLVGLTKVVALETAEANITCNAICPGWVRTPLVHQQIEALAAARAISLEEAAAELLGEKQPTKRFVTPESIAQLVTFLCSEHGAAMTGEILTVDGGWTAR